MQLTKYLELVRQLILLQPQSVFYMVNKCYMILMKLFSWNQMHCQRRDQVILVNQITVSHKERWLTVAGIRSTGLTASLGIGNYVTRCIENLEGEHAEATSLKKCAPVTNPLPPLSSVVEQFHT